MKTELRLSLQAVGAGLLIAVLAATLTTACEDEFSGEATSAVGGGSGTSVGGAVAAGGSSCSDAGDCAACKSCAVETDCKGERDACAENQACVDLDACVSGCGETIECLATCAQGFPGGVEAYTALTSCIRCQACMGVCQGCGILHCINGTKDGDETAPDCGGPDCDKCGIAVPCTTGTDCASGFCADNVCCETACDGECEACVSSKTGATDGTCGLIAEGADPDTECADQGGTTCGTNGVCDGAGHCALYGSGTACGDAQGCSGGLETKQDLCDGMGICDDQGTVNCAPYPCGPTSCAISCSTPSQCAMGYTCSGGMCVPLKPNGQSCTIGGECASGNCANNVCCDQACNGACEACVQAQTGVTNGVCAAVLANTDPGGDCAQQAPSTCGTTGVCNGIGGCQFYGTSTTCGSAQSCTGGVQTNQDYCNGMGSCSDYGILPCAPYTCDSSMMSCLINCTQQSQCVSTYYCNTSTFQCLLKKAQGTACGAGYECSSGSCVDGFCCNTACGSTCQACSNAKTGAANGTCAPIPNGNDPDSECQVPANEVCNGQGACRCHDGITNGDEDDVNCGNTSVCGLCPHNWACQNNCGQAQAWGECCISASDCSNCTDQHIQCNALNGKGCINLGQQVPYESGGTWTDGPAGNCGTLEFCLYWMCTCQ